MKDPTRKPSRRTLLMGAAGIAGGAALTGGAAGMIPLQAEAAAGRGEVALYKDPQCGCCEGYADYLRENGFAVKASPTNDLTMLAEKYGIPGDATPCHISLIGGYVVGGHIPIAVVDRLLSEKPKIVGVNLPGMPTGTPGMPGPNPGPLTIYEIGAKPPKAYTVI